MAKITGWRQDRDEPTQHTYWSTGYGLRRGFIEVKKVSQISARKNAFRWYVTIYKNMGHYEDAKPLPVVSFGTKKEALNYAYRYMRANPRG